MTSFCTFWAALPCRVMPEASPPRTDAPKRVSPKSVSIVPHTHWDREWYRPFESFRSRLVAVLDGVLDALEGDDRWRGFQLDGQVAVVDDYLEVRPDALGRVSDLAGAGRISVGPWYVLMDEFCVSGETILRNLELGLESSRRFGTASSVGYLPDMFGHIAQMPQILRLAGMSHAVVWRGVPRAIGRTGFTWVAPDGSEVRAEYLPVGYASGAFLPRDPSDLVRRVAALDAESQHFALEPAAPLLLMNGTDHQGIQEHLPDTVDAANALQDRYLLGLTTLSEHLRDAAGGGLPRWVGELRSGARAPILMGVLSNRRDLKQAAARAERALERLAEPMASLWLPADLWPQERFERAWREMIRNSAHDSICGCSADEVSRAVLHRYDNAVAIAGDICASALAIAAVAVAAPGPVVLNPSARARQGIVEVTLAGNDAPPGTQQVAVTPAGAVRREGTGRDLGSILGRLALEGWLTVGATPATARVAFESGRVELTLVCDEAKPGSPACASAIAEAWALAGAHSESPLVVTVEREAAQTVLARTGPVPGYGWRSWEAAPLEVDPVEVGPCSLRNGLVDVVVDPATGTFSLDGRSGYGRLVDEGDAGDTYNYCPPAGDVRVDTPSAVEVHVVDGGPLRGRLRIVTSYDWPQRLCEGSRTGSERIEVTSDLELLAGEEALRVTTTFVNPCRDHRVRVLFPLPSPAEATEAECAFATVERGEAEGGPRECALATYPARRFVIAGGLTVVHDGMMEHELLRDEQALALTVLRCTGMLSKPFLPTRPNTAGPPLPLEGPQMIGPVTLSYALSTGGVDPWAMADDVLVPLPVVRSAGTGHLPPSGSRLRVDGAEVSALRRRGGCIEVRLYNPSPATTTVRIPLHSGSFVELTGEEVGRWETEFELGPWKIANVRLDALTLD